MYGGVRVQVLGDWANMGSGGLQLVALRLTASGFNGCRPSALNPKPPNPKPLNPRGFMGRARKPVVHRAYEALHPSRDLSSHE